MVHYKSYMILSSITECFTLRTDYWKGAIALATDFEWTQPSGWSEPGARVAQNDAREFSAFLNDALYRIPDEEDAPIADLEFPYCVFSQHKKRELRRLIAFCRRSGGFVILGTYSVRVMTGSDSEVILQSAHRQCRLNEVEWLGAIELAKEVGLAVDSSLEGGGGPDGQTVTAKEAMELSVAIEKTFAILPHERDWSPSCEIPFPFILFIGPGQFSLIKLMEFCRESNGFVVRLVTHESPGSPQRLANF